MSVHDEKFNRGKVRLINFIALVMGFAQAVLLYIMSTYFKRAFGSENVGVFYFISYCIVLLFLLNFHKIVRIFGKSNAFYFSLLFKLIAISFLLILDPGYLGIGFMMVFIIFGNLEWVSLDFILESFSTDRMSGRIRGKHLMIMNTGILFGPFLSTSILERFDFFGIFFFLFLLNAGIFVVALLGLRNVNHRFRQDIQLMDIFKKVICRKNILRIYWISFVLDVFYALLIIYTPIYLLNLGMSLRELGIILTIMLVPFVIVQYPMGILADKRFGEKEFLIISLFIMGVSSFAVYFIGSSSVFIWSMVLFAGRVGAALVEVLRDSYFFKKIDAQDVDLIDFFRTASSSAYIVSTAMAAIVLAVFSIKAIFVLVGVIVFSALYPAFRLVDNRCEREIMAE